MKKIKQRIYHYTAIFERNETRGYTVTVPSLPGLVTEGKDLNDARFMAEDAVRCYLRGLRTAGDKFPEESELAQVRLDVKV